MIKIGKWIMGIIAAVIAAIITNELIKYHIFNLIWKGVCKFLALQIGIIWVILIIVIFLALMFVEHLYYTTPKDNDSNKGNNIPKFVKEYKHDSFGGEEYKWQWQKTNNNLWYTIDIHQYCKLDDTPLVGNRCPRCGKVYLSGAYPDDLQVLILDNVKKKYGNEYILLQA
jgi:hypothetical protein